MIRSMISTNIYDVKTHLSDYLKQVEGGERVVICRHNVPVAELRAVSETPKNRNRQEPGWGRSKFGPFEVDDAAFFDPMPEEFLKAFYGE